LLAYNTGWYTPSYSCIMHASRLLLDASVDNMISRFKSGNLKIGSDDNIFLTSLNALSCSEYHSTYFKGWLAVKFTPRLISVRDIMQEESKDLMFKGSDEIQSYAFWHGKLRLYI